MGNEMLKAPLFIALILSAVVSVEANAGKYSTLYFQGGITSPSCNFDLHTVSCNDPMTHQVTTQNIQAKRLVINMLSGEVISVSSNFKQIKIILVKQLEINEVLVSLNYN